MPYVELRNVRSVKGALSYIKQHIYEKLQDLEVEYYKTDEPVCYEERESGEKKIGQIGDSWGELWNCAWFHFTGTVPKEAAGKKIVLKIDLSGELYVADEKGVPVRGLTTKMSTFDKSLGEPEKTEFPFVDCAVGGERVDIWADSANNDLFGDYQDAGRIREACICAVRDDVKDLYYDWEVLAELVEHLDEHSARRHRALFALSEAFSCLRDMTVEEVSSARAVLGRELQKRNGDYPLEISAIGHAHMDLAWLWPIRETKRKVARTFATVVRNMEKYDDYMFGASQAQQYKWLKDGYPELYEQVKRYVKEGRIELQGGAWVESDASLPSGEAFARQFLYGQKFFNEEFGIMPEVAWLPDTFGFPGTLPQIFKKSGIKYFITSRAVFNSNYKYHHSFWWEGLDGSRILTHAMPEGTYNSSAAPRALIKTEHEYMDKGVSGNAMITFGIGDGGGGPGEEHLERLKREKNLMGLPPTKQETSAAFFAKLEKDADRFKSWRGELFFFAFQGTFASQSRNKYYNRKLELALRELEYAGVVSGAYPKAEIDALWEETLLYQFHDILPGSSIDRVNLEAVARYQEMLGHAQELTAKAYAQMCGEGTGGYTAINSLSFARNEWVKHNGHWLRVNVGALSSAPCAQAKVDISSLVADEDKLENDVMALRFSKDGGITSMIDKRTGRELLRAPANVLHAYEDLGDGWGIEANYRHKAPEGLKLVSSATAIDGPTATRTSSYTYRNNTLEQTIVLTMGSVRVDFKTKITMNDKHVMFRTTFPLDLTAKEAVCEVQYGHVHRPTHENTLLESDQYEVYAHKWMDYSDGVHGVAMLNDGRYGHRIRDNALDLDLVRTTTFPGKNGDIGDHEFVYSILPHEGDHHEGVIEEAYRLNVPVAIVDGALNAPVKPIVKLDSEQVVVEAIKQAEDGRGLIVRLYEAHGMPVKVKVDVEGTAALTDILERDAQDAAWDEQEKTLCFKAFEVHTLRIQFEK